MWVQAITDLAKVERSLAKAMLHLNVLPRGTDARQRVTAILASQLLGGVEERPGMLHFMLPAGDPSNALITATSLLITDFFHQMQRGQRLEGNLLLVTPAISDSIEHLESLVLEGSEVRLSEMWPVESFSRYQPLQGDRPRVIVANPGWITRLQSLPGKIGGVIVDATHPRTLAQLGPLEEATRGTQARIFFTPPLPETDLDVLGASRATWLWSPGARIAISEELRLPSPASPSRQQQIYVAQGDPDFDAALSEVRRALVALMGVGSRPLQGVLEAWGIYHRMRQLAIPLQQYEALARRGWGGMMLKEQISNLDEVQLPRAALQAPWRTLVESLQRSYALLDQRTEPAKLQAIQARIEALLESQGDPLFVVTPTQAEADALRRVLSARVDDLQARELAGQIEFLHASEQARRSHTGQPHRTLLSGYRHGQLRYLDTYPTIAAEVVVYPHEVSVEMGLDQRTYSALETLQSSDHLRATLTHLGIPCPPGDLATPTQRPQLRVLNLEGQTIQHLQAAASATVLDLDDLATMEIRRLTHQEKRPADSLLTSRTEGCHAQHTLTLHFEDGSMTMQESDILDVFYPDTGKLVRHRAADILPGMHIVTMVDDAYSSIFERLVEVLDAKSPPSQRLVLQLWRQAKNHLLSQYPSMRALYRELQKDGLDVEYATLRSWLIEFGNESLYYPPLRLLAVRSGVYTNEQMMEHTFAAIVAVRGRNRTAGRTLHAVMRAIATGQGYKAALEGARNFNKELGEMLNAAELRQVIQTTTSTGPRLASA